MHDPLDAMSAADSSPKVLEAQLPHEANGDGHIEW